MIYFLYGSDTDKAKKKLNELVESLVKKKPNASSFKYDWETFLPDLLPELIGGQGLFEHRYIVILDRVLENPEHKDVIIDMLEGMHDSENIFIIYEKQLDKTTLGKFEKNSEKVQKFELVEEIDVKKHAFNIFALTDALGKKDKRALWVLYQKALMNEVSFEEIHGILLWQVKAMLLAQSSKSATESGLKPFVFGKSQTYAKNFPGESLHNLSGGLVSLYHDVRRGIGEPELALEKFILEM